MIRKFGGLGNVTDLVAEGPPQGQILSMSLSVDSRQFLIASTASNLLF